MFLKTPDKPDLKKAFQTIHARLVLLFVFAFMFLYSHGRDKAKIKTGDTQIASVGIHIMNIYQVDLTTNSFFADFYLWCRWKGDIDPLKNLEFLNSEEQWGFSKDKLYNSTMLLKNGIKYNIIHVQGKFHHSFILNNYPLDEQKVSIELENSIYTHEQLLYEPDSANSGIQSDISIPGWQLKSILIHEKNHIYATNFGLPENMNNDSYSNLSFSLNLHRPVAFFLWKFMLPVMIVLLSSLGAILIFPGYTDARIYAPVGALLTTVFLQQASSANLPDISYLILTDKIYVVVYIAILAGIFQAIFTANIVKNPTDAGHKKAKRLDRVFAIFIILFLLASALFLILQ